MPLRSWFRLAPKKPPAACWVRRSPRCPETSEASAKEKGAGKHRPQERWGIEPYAETRARLVQAPGGWGAEESDTRTRRALINCTAYRSAPRRAVVRNWTLLWNFVTNP